jgi:hypothetical protein
LFPWCIKSKTFDESGFSTINPLKLYETSEEKPYIQACSLLLDLTSSRNLNRLHIANIKKVLKEGNFHLDLDIQKNPTAKQVLNKINLPSFNKICKAKKALIKLIYEQASQPINDKTLVQLYTQNLYSRAKNLNNKKVADVEANN